MQTEFCVYCFFREIDYGLSRSVVNDYRKKFFELSRKRCVIFNGQVFM